MNKITELNDQARQAWGVYPNTRVFMTEGIRALDESIQSQIAERVQKFGANWSDPDDPEDVWIRDPFTEDNDPYGEHDFGSFHQEGAGKIFWKFDYYDENMEYGSDDPADPAKTTRVLTIMLASEY